MLTVICLIEYNGLAESTDFFIPSTDPGDETNSVYVLKDGVL